MFLRISILLVLLWMPCLALGQPIGVVTVELNAKPTLTRSQVTINDIADVASGDVITRRKIANLDLTNLEPLKAANLSKLQVETRILLSGIPARNFQVLGPERLSIQWDGQSTESRIVELLRQAFADTLREELNDVEVRIARSLPEGESLFSAQTTLKPMLPSNATAGRQSIRIRVFEGDRFLRSVVVPIEVRVARPVFSATHDMSSGDTLGLADIFQTRKFVDFETAVDVEGKELVRTIREGEVIKPTHLRSTRKKPNYVVRSRDLVEIVAQRRTLQVRISNAVALQRGRVGDTIRVRAPETKRVLLAQVVDAGLVRVNF